MNNESAFSAPVPTGQPLIEKKGDPSHTTLYIILALLLLAIIGLSGYIAWDYFQTEEEAPTTTVSETEESDNTPGNSDTSDIEEEAEEPDQTESETSKISYQYTSDGNAYMLYLNNPADLASYIEDQSYYGDTLVIQLDPSVTLEIHVMPDIDQSTLGGAYGTIITNVTGDIYRTRYLGDYYVLDVGSDMCEIPDQDPCVVTVFHNDEKGALSAYIQYDNIPSAEIFELADDLIKSYTIEAN